MLYFPTNNVNEDKYRGWFVNRVRGFSGAVGDTYTPVNLTEMQRPHRIQLNTLSGIISANHSLQHALFCNRKSE